MNFGVCRNKSGAWQWCFFRHLVLR